jgi:2,3-bisphosphoglycerate-dependent phosphoglycerate mutase
MVVSTHDGQIYEDQADYQLDHPMEGSTKQPLRVTITPHMNAGESEQGSPQGGIQEDHKLFFVRHGETEDNEENIIRTKDAQLTDTGRKQAEVAAKQLKSEGVDAIVSSNLPRAKESAHIIAAKLGIVPQFDNQLNTWDMGKMEGQPCDSTNTKLMKDAVEKTPDEPVGGGESFNQFKDRSQAGIRDAINNNPGKKLAILTHSKVEATLKAWEKTGQDNPSIDAPTVSREPDKPGSVEPFTMQANSTIMAGDTSDTGEMRMIMPWHLDTNEPIPKMTPSISNTEIEQGLAQDAREAAAATTRAGVRGYQGYAPSLNEPAEITSERLFRQIMPDRFDLNLTPSMRTVPDAEITTKEGGGYTPVSDKYRMYPGKGPTTQSDTPLSRYFQGQGDTLAEQLMDILKHPEQQTPMPGMAMPPGRLLQGRFIEGLKKMIDAGKSFSEIGKTLGMTRDAVAGLVKRNNLGRKPFEPAMSGAQGDPEYEKALSDWMKNQFEGGPTEPENLKNQYPEPK